jgi:16S rRNA (guanine(966)-N(2))-methyltransferase RsmD
MRIITGSAKGAKLKAPHGDSTRPTADRVKESLFNILGHKVTEAHVLDLFAGTGNLGLEALSRGASHAVFVDQELQCVALIKENARHTKLLDQTQILRQEVLRAMDLLARSDRQFDLIFCDPPYNKGFVGAVLQKTDCYRILRTDGIVIMEHSRHEMLPEHLENLECIRTQRYGETLISFLGYKQEV